MPRIRTIKPEFFRDEELQELQAAYQTVPVMLVYAGLWGHCDKNGTFEWRPRQLKLDILPFLPFSMDQALEILEGAGFVKKFEAMGKQYGSIDRFPEHQRISGSEATDPAKYPKYQGDTEKEALGKQRGSNGDKQVSQEGKGREGKGEAVSRKRSTAIPPDFGISDRVRAWAVERGYEANLDAHLEYFKNYAAANAKTYADWDAAFRNCIDADWGGVRKARGKAPVSADPFAGMVHG